MTDQLAFAEAFARCPLVAILRGVRPGEVETIGDVLVDAGFTIIEVPLNSPEPLDSIGRLARRFRGRALIGAGTVLDAGSVSSVLGVGGRLIVSPGTNAEVIGAAVAAGASALPGVATPTEAFTALAAGATALKLFPAEGASPLVLKAMLAVLPIDTAVLPVGGIESDGMEQWRSAGAQGFGLGSALYMPGRSVQELRRRADAFVRAWADRRADESSRASTYIC